MILGISIMLWKQKSFVSDFLHLQQQDKYAKFALIDGLLAKEYLNPEELQRTQEQMIERALKAYVAGIDDPYTNYLTKEENTELVNILHDETGISGIGAVVEKRENYVQIAEVIKN
jgi:C-terminal processing protease CtpA/Prc